MSCLLIRAGCPIFNTVQTMTKFFHWILAATIVVAVIQSCSEKLGGDNPYKSLEKVTYKSTNDLFPNPERGFLVHREIISGGSTAVIPDNSFEVERFLNRSLMYTIYYMPDFMESDISQEFLDLIAGNLQQFRKNGFKCVLRFAYKDSWTELDHPWDPTEEVVHRHIDQLAPILQEYSDVIFCLEAGFIGVYGEWYYTDNFIFSPSNRDDYEPRRKLLKKLLDVLPEDRQIAVRYPIAKMKIFDLGFADSLTIATAHDGSDISRVAHHNDCYVSSSNDVGTYISGLDREYVYNDTRYTIWGGESCDLTPYGTCDKSVPASASHHMTYLNNSYHQGVISRWRTEGCYETIDRRMGYRLVLQEAYFSQETTAGNNMRIVLKIFNEGFAAPMNPRDVEFVFIAENGEKTIVPIEGVDPRFWFDGMVSTVDVEIALPNVSGTYDLYFNLPDPKPTLHDNPHYSIRLANKDVWNAELGYNKLKTVIVK